jgi:hypothetical protein
MNSQTLGRTHEPATSGDAGRLQLSRGARRAMVASQVIAAAVGGVYGFGFGEQIAGPLLGVVTGANTAFFGALMVSAGVDLWLRWRPSLRRGIRGS